MPSRGELQQLSEFAQLLKADMAARQGAIPACNLSAVVTLAHANEHPMASTGVLIGGSTQQRAQAVLRPTGIKGGANPPAMTGDYSC